jgi:acyl-ACP thioesterase
MNILQDIATENADLLGLGLEICREHNLSWVGSNYLIQILRMPKLNEHMKITTWPAEKKLWGAIRDFIITDESGAPIIKASSQWVLIDFVRRRPVMLNKYFPDYNCLEERVLETEFPKIDIAEDGADIKEFSVRFDDIDVNEHVNNSIYPLWASESTDSAYRLKHLPAELEICYKKEALYGEKVEVRTKQNESESLHTIYDKESGAVLADCRIVWREITL